MYMEYEKFNPIEKKAYKLLYEAIKEKKDEVIFSGIYKGSMLEKIICCLKNRRVEIFYVDLNTIQYQILPVGTKFKIQYIMPKGNIDSEIYKLDRWVQKVLKDLKLTEENDDYFKCLKIHNYLIRNTKYCYEALENPSAFFNAFTVKGVYDEKEAVCEGISKAFKLLCDKAGVKETHIVCGNSYCNAIKKSIPHAWNVVKINNIYSHIDVTWDLNYSVACKSNRYDYFMIPDKWMSVDHNFKIEVKSESIENSYFNKKHCFLKNLSEVNQYIKQQVMSKKNIIYFKLSDENSVIPKAIEKKIDKLFMDVIQSKVQNNYYIEKAHNSIQDIYYYRVKILL